MNLSSYSSTGIGSLSPSRRNRRRTAEGTPAARVALKERARAEAAVSRSVAHEIPAKFPRPKRLEDFDKNPNVSPEVVADLKSPSWVREGRLLVLIGDSGTGKSHLLIGVGTAIAEAGCPSATSPRRPW